MHPERDFPHGASGVGRSGAVQKSQRSQQCGEVSAGGPRRHPVPDTVVEREQSHGISLAQEQVSQRGGQEARVIQLGHQAAGLGGPVHRPARVHGEVRPQVRFLFVLLDVVPIRAGVHPPVHMADVVARHVWPVLGELYGKAPVGGVMKADQEAFHHAARDELEVPQRGEMGWIEPVGPPQILAGGPSADVTRGTAHIYSGCSGVVL